MYRYLIGVIKRLLFQESEEPRRAIRSAQPEVVVYYWDGSAPEGRHIRDLSQSGAYIYTPERWYIGTIIRIVLQYRALIRDDGAAVPAASTCIPARVVRHGPDGVAVEFAFRNKREGRPLRAFLDAIPVHPSNPAFPTAVFGRKGQALIEFALIVPLVFLLAVNAVNFGGFLFAWITVANAARVAGQYMVMSSASPGQPTRATTTQISALVTNEVTSLMNRSSVAVVTCTNSNGTMTPANCTTLADPEPATYTLATVDVTYTYKPFIPLFSFPGLGISATLPSTTIHRKAVMRMLQ